MPSLHKKKKISVIGIMSGTSADGADFVLSEVQRSGHRLRIRYVAMAGFAFSKKLREQILKAARQELSTDALAELHFTLGKFYAQKLLQVQRQKKWKFDLIGLHGQTVFHRGREATLQIGEPSFLSGLVGVPVVSDFRSADIAVGGQGAPLAPIFHQVAFAKAARSFSVHNLGGISNLTFFSKGKLVSAFDTGPANMPIDWLIGHLTKGKRSFDRGGKWASQGKHSQALVADLLAHPYFKKRPPKSCGREEFGEAWLKPILKRHRHLSAEDQLASVTEFIAVSIKNTYLKLVPQKTDAIIFCGGGARNLYLLSRIKSHLPGVRILTTDDFGWPTQAVEGGAFALLAAAHVFQIAFDLHSVTGARKRVVLGKLTKL